MYVLWLGFVFLAMCVCLLRVPVRVPSAGLYVVVSSAGLYVSMCSILVHLYCLQYVFGYVCMAGP